MKKTIVMIMLAAALAMTAGTVCAQEETGTEEVQKDIIEIDVEGTSIEVSNTTPGKITEAAISVENVKEEKAAEEETAVTETTETKKITSLVLTEEDGDVHKFKDVNVAEWSEAELYDEYDIFYIKYKDASGKEQEAAEDKEKIKFEKTMMMYSTARANIREGAGTDTKAIRSTELGEEWEVADMLPGWIHVKSGDTEGYVYHLYLTADKTKADQIVQEKKAAEEAAAAARAAEEAAWAAQQAAAQQAAAQQAAAQQAPYEVGRQAYDDCDGSGHGYYEITYSDGSVVIQEY